MIYKVSVNKGQLVQLLRARGFHPTEKRARFQQKPRCWELVWKEPAGQCKAVAEYVGGERWERCRGQSKRPERVAGIGERRSCIDSKENTEDPNREASPQSACSADSSPYRARGALYLRIEHPGGHKYEVIPRGEQLRLAILRPAMPELKQ